MVKIVLVLTWARFLFNLVTDYILYYSNVNQMLNYNDKINSNAITPHF